MLFITSSTKNLNNKLILNYEERNRKIPNMRNNISFNNKDFTLSRSGTRISTESRKDLSLNYSKKIESNSNISFMNERERENNSFNISNILKPLEIIQNI